MAEMNIDLNLNYDFNQVRDSRRVTQGTRVTHRPQLRLRRRPDPGVGEAARAPARARLRRPQEPRELLLHELRVAGKGGREDAGREGRGEGGSNPGGGATVRHECRQALCESEECLAREESRTTRRHCQSRPPALPRCQRARPPRAHEQ
jgi:hypothetical protein